MVNLSIKWLAFIGLTIFISSCTKPEAQLLHIQGQTMGTYYNVTYVLSAEQQQKELSTSKLQILIDQQLELVNDQMSTYRPQSELSLFNKSTQSSIVSDATIKVVQSALSIFKLSNGAFDVTVGPVVNLWGFGPDKKPDKVPSEDLIQATKQRIGSQYLSIEGNKLIKSKPDLYVDLSSIAKGYGVDVVSDFLQDMGINNYLVDIGGELRASGTKLKEIPWTVAIEGPQEGGQTIQRLLHIGNNAIATSGDYRNYFEFDGIRYSHTIDPETGRPITHKLVSVTVIDKSTMIADALATAISVLGPEKGLKFAIELKQPVFLLIKQNDEFIESFTTEFEPFFIEK